VASTEVTTDEHDAQMIDDAPGPCYPVYDVREMINCEPHQPMKNMTFKVAISNALPCLPEALHHGNPIRAGYACVSVDDIVPGFEDLELDFPTPEGDVRHGDVKCHIVLWQKKYIIFLGSAPRPPTSGNPSPPSPVNVVHLRHPQSTSGTVSTDAAPESTSGVVLADAAPKCTSHTSAHAVLQCTSSASGEAAPHYYSEGGKVEQGRYISTTDKVVHKTTKIPEPSLKPLP
jgi:hypothetical protein